MPTDELPRYIVQEKATHGTWVNVAVLLSESFAHTVAHGYQTMEADYSSFDVRVITVYGRVIL